MVKSLDIDAFLDSPGCIVDVRSPAEYEQGHLPGALNLPLFDNEERTQVGTCYKHAGHDAAVELGLSIVGGKINHLVQQAKEILPDRPVRLHCWRGGMRSQSVAALLEILGFQVTLLTGGYKTFRRWVRTTVSTPKPIITLGGMTGTGKTSVLYALADRGEQIIDLEKYANHRGSSYGNLGLPPQPSTEHFENLVAIAWAACTPDRPVWIEAESRRIGTCRVPDELFQQMMKAPVLEIQRSRAERIQLLIADYGDIDRAGLIEATQRLRKRLGGDRTQTAVENITAEDATTAIDIVLDYYDKTYTYDLNRREVDITPLDVTGLAAPAVAQRLLEVSASLP